MQELLCSDSLVHGVCGLVNGSQHKCKHEFRDKDGRVRSCCFNLYSDDFQAAIDQLKSTRKTHLLMSQRDRGRLAFAAMHLVRAAGENAETSKGTVALHVQGRPVCESVFISHFCVCKSVFKKMKVSLRVARRLVRVASRVHERRLHPRSCAGVRS